MLALDLPPQPRILIVRLSAIGDVICAVPALTALRRRFPGAHLAWIVESTSAPLLRHHPDLDEVIVVPRRGLRRGLRRPGELPRAVGGLGRALARLRALRVDLALDLQGNLKSGVFTGLSGARYRVGHDGTYRKEAPNALFTNVKVHPVPPGAPTRHRVERDLGMLRALGIPARYERRPVTVPPPVEAAAARFVAALPGGGPVVVIHPSTSRFGAYKRWAPDRFAALGNRLVRARDCRLAVSWGPGEEALARRVAAGVTGERARLFPLGVDLLFVAAVYRRAALVVGADSGPLHLAALMGAATLTLFGPKDPEIFRPMGSRAAVVWKGVPCSPCPHRRCRHVTCMESLEVDEVLAPALALLDRGGRGIDKPGAARQSERPASR